MHRNARLTPQGRLLLCQRIEAGWPVAHAAAAMGISRDRAYVWWRRYQEEGVAGLEDRSSRPAVVPGQDEAVDGTRIVTLRTQAGLGPGPDRRHRADAGLDRPPGAGPPRPQPSRPPRPGHPDPDPARSRCPAPASWSTSTSRSSAGFPTGGGWRVHGRAARPHAGRDGQGTSATPSSTPPSTATPAWPTPRSSPTSRAPPRPPSGPEPPPSSPAHGITIERVLTDNGSCYRSRQFDDALGAVDPHLHPALPARHQRQGRALQPHPPRRMGLRPALELRRPTHPGLDRWLHRYNHHRHHTAIGGPPVSRVSNLAGHYN